MALGAGGLGAIAASLPALPLLQTLDLTRTTGPVLGYARVVRHAGHVERVLLAGVVFDSDPDNVDDLLAALCALGQTSTSLRLLDLRARPWTPAGTLAGLVSFW